MTPALDTWSQNAESTHIEASEISTADKVEQATGLKELDGDGQEIEVDDENNEYGGRALFLRGEG